MKHCRNCENCNKDLVCEYVKGLEIYHCTKDNHRIEEPFWEKCEDYSRKFLEPVHADSFLYQIYMRLKREKDKRRANDSSRTAYSNP